MYIGATGLLHKDLYRIFGPITFHNAFEDSVLGYRALLLNSISYIEDPLIYYRIGGLSSTAKVTKINLINCWLERPRKLRVILDVFRQRLADLFILKNNLNDYNYLISDVKKVCELYEKRLLIYQQPFKFILLIFTLNYAKYLKALYRELIALFLRKF